MTTPAIGGRWEARRLLAVLTAFAVVATVIMVFSGTARADHVDFWPNSSEANDAPFWEAWGASEEGEDDWVCDKVDDQGSDGTYTLGDPPAGHDWRLLIAKKAAGDEANTLYWNPVSGGEYEAASGGGYSHIIVCSRPSDEDTTTTTEATTTTTEATTTTVEDTTTTSVEDTTTTSVEDTTTTSVEDTTTSSVSDTTVTTAESTTSSSVSDTTVTTAESTTSSSVSDTTVTTADTSTTATVEGTVVTTAPAEDPDDDLPFTGMNAESMLGISIALLGLGVALLTLTRKLKDNN